MAGLYSAAQPQNAAAPWPNIPPPRTLQIANHIVVSRSMLCERLAAIEEEINALKWKLWQGQVQRAISALENIIGDMDYLGQKGDLSAARLKSLGLPAADLYQLKSYRYCGLRRAISLGS